MGTIKAGDLRQVITLIKPTRITDERGRSRATWEDAATVPAAKNDVSGREFWQAQAYNAEDIVTFTIRWREDVDATWRVRHHGITYNIQEVNHLGYMQDYLRLKCRDVRKGGS